MPTAITGLRQAVRDLEALGVEVADLKVVMGAIASKAADVMQPFIPEGPTGRLRKSARGNKAKGKALVTVGTARIDYAPVINYGSPKRGIKPADFKGKTDRVMEDLAPRMLDDGITALLTERGLI